MRICKSEPRISFGTQQQPYLFLSYLKNPYCFCLKLKKKPQNTHFQVYENFEFYSKKIEKNDFPCLEIMSILLGKCKIRKSKLYSYRLLSHCGVRYWKKILKFFSHTFLRNRPVALAMSILGLLDIRPCKNLIT